MDLLNFFFNLHQIMYSFGKQREKIWSEGHFKMKSQTPVVPKAGCCLSGANHLTLSNHE